MSYWKEAEPIGESEDCALADILPAFDLSASCVERAQLLAMSLPASRRR